MIEAELPDGTILEFPEGTAPEVMQRVVKQRMGTQQAPQQAPAPQERGLLGDIGQTIGNVAAGAVRGAGSIGATLLTPIDAAARGLGIQNDFIGRTDRRQAMDAGLQSMGAETDSLGYGAGKIGAEIAGTLGVGGGLARGAAMIPGAAKAAPALIEALRTGGMSVNGLKGAAGLATRAAGGAATGGASAGLIDPNSAGTAAVIGGVLPIAAAGAAKLGGAVGNAFRPSEDVAQIARKAQSYGIPIGVGDLAQGRTVQAARSIMRDAPVTGAMARGAQDAKQEAFNRAVGNTFGADAPKLTTDVIDAAKEKMGSEFNRIWSNNKLAVTDDFTGKLQELREISAKLPKNEGGSLAAEIDDLASKMKPDESGNMFIDGDIANKFQQYLRRRSEGSAGLRNELGDLRQSIITAFNNSVSPQDAAALTMNRTQYKAFKTVEPLLKSAELGVAGRMPGDIPAALLPGAVSKGYKNIKNAPLADLSQIGSRFLVDRTPQTGGSARAALQNTAIGAALLGGGMTSLPLTALAMGGALGGQALLNSPKIANKVLNSSGQPSAALAKALRAGQLTAPSLISQ